MSDKGQSILSNLKIKIEDTFKSKTDLISQTTSNTIQTCHELQESSKNRSKSYFKRKLNIDFLVYANLGITPILFILLSYVIFFKK
ncbi:hypothetical protein [Clostridium sp.]|uniref:hypothetical protein n=1 Tax=Clostridium sp. TaxID=1506 RepID=UPI003FD75607